MLLGDFLRDHAEELGWEYTGTTKFLKWFRHIESGLVIKIKDRERRNNPRSDIILMTNTKQPKRPECVDNLIQEYRRRYKEGSVRIVINYLYKRD